MRCASSRPAAKNWRLSLCSSFSDFDITRQNCGIPYSCLCLLYRVSLKSWVLGKNDQDASYSQKVFSVYMIATVRRCTHGIQSAVTQPWDRSCWPATPQNLHFLSNFRHSHPRAGLFETFATLFTVLWLFVTPSLSLYRMVLTPDISVPEKNPYLWRSQELPVFRSALQPRSLPM